MSSTRSTPLRILCADNRPDFLESLVALMEEELGAEVVAARSVEEACEKVAELVDELDVVVTDMNFKDRGGPEGGLEVVREAARMSGGDLPALVLTAYAGVRNASKVMEAGGYCYVQKGMPHGETNDILLAKVRQAVEVRRAKARLKEQERKNSELLTRLVDDLDEARGFVESLQPTRELDNGSWRIAHAVEPCDELGGDLVVIEEWDDDRLVVGLCDVVGHGVKAALVAGMIRAAFSSLLRDESDWEDVASKLLSSMGFLEIPRFATAAFFALEPDGRVRKIQAGHPATLALRDGEVEVHDSEGPALYRMKGVAEVTHEAIDLDPFRSGDRLVVVSDGVLEAAEARAPETAEPEDCQFGVGGLAKACGLAAELPLPEATDRVLEAVAEHRDGDAKDDVSVVLIERI